MKVDEFNAAHTQKYRFFHRPSKYGPEFHYLAQWCPEVNSWQRVPPSWIRPRAHFDGFEIPDKILQGVEGYIEADGVVPYILVVNEKHGTRHFDVSTLGKLGAACLQLLTERKDEGYYYGDDDFLAELQLIIENCSYFSALRLLESHDGYEYESFEMERLTVSDYVPKPVMKTE